MSANFYRTSASIIILTEFLDNIASKQVPGIWNIAQHILMAATTKKYIRTKPWNISLETHVLVCGVRLRFHFQNTLIDLRPDDEWNTTFVPYSSLTVQTRPRFAAKPQASVFTLQLLKSSVICVLSPHTSRWSRTQSDHHIQHHCKMVIILLIGRNYITTIQMNRCLFFGPLILLTLKL